MPRTKKTRFTYDPETRTKIITAAIGKKLSEGYIAAKEVGFKGSPQTLYQMLHALKGKKPGRPKGAGKPTKQVSGNSLSAIEQAIEQEVQRKVKAALSTAIGHLEKLIQ